MYPFVAAQRMEDNDFDYGSARDLEEEKREGHIRYYPFRMEEVAPAHDSADIQGCIQMDCTVAAFVLWAGSRHSYFGNNLAPLDVAQTAHSMACSHLNDLG